jgi:alkane 1-monooxygenase
MRLFGPGWGALWLCLMAFIAIPLGDYLLPLDWTNPLPEETRELSKQMSFRFVTWFWLVVQMLIIFVSLKQISRLYDELDYLKYFGLILVGSIGTGGIGITIAHELVHKSNRWERLIGKIILVTVCYGHWEIEHLKGHHKMVATPKDPATSKRGQSLYAFWIQTLIGTFKSAWALEQERLVRSENISTVWTWKNEVLRYVACQILFGCAVYWAYGALGVKIWLQISTGAILFLETVNYTEHYGLSRRELKKGVFESVTPAHSWNTAHAPSNFLLFKLQRHSDHHAHAGRRYQVLRSFRNSPQMPLGYPAMVVLALFPPLWTAYMNPRLDEYNAQLEQWRVEGYTMEELFPHKTPWSDKA